MTEAPTAREWQEEGIAHIDVRGLPPPQPLIAILRRVRALAPGACLLVHHDRDPVMLYPELAEIGWEAERIAAPAGEVRLLLREAT
jgi:TusA-related sulfurtransferase